PCLPEVLGEDLGRVVRRSEVPAHDETGRLHGSIGRAGPGQEVSVPGGELSERRAGPGQIDAGGPDALCNISDRARTLEGSRRLQVLELIRYQQLTGDVH